MKRMEKFPESCLVMAGGSGSRMANPQKFLLEIGNESILKRLIRILNSWGLKIYVAATHSNEHDIRSICEGCQILVTSGAGYAKDLHAALKKVKSFPVLVIGADTVVLDSMALRSCIESACDKDSDLVNIINTGTGFSASLFRRPPVYEEEVLVHTDFISSCEAALNINTPEDFRHASGLLEGCDHGE
jgi:GTP:adenosylcobinamide-phosphate guanylyltransferase